MRLARIRHLGLFCFWSVLIYAVRMLALFNKSLPTELSMVLSLAAILTILFACIKIIMIHIERLHDFDFSGWWVLLCFAPILGQLWLLVILCKRGNEGPNHFGPPPPEPRTGDYGLVCLLPIFILCELLF